MIEGKTKTGFEYKVDENALDDAELIEKIAAMQKGEGYELFEVMEDLLGTKQKKEMYEHCRNKKTKKVSLKACGTELDEIFTELAAASPAAKNL